MFLKWTIYGILNELLSILNVNVARFARNVERDFSVIFKHCGVVAFFFDTHSLNWTSGVKIKSVDNCFQKVSRDGFLIFDFCCFLKLLCQLQIETIGTIVPKSFDHYQRGEKRKWKRCIYC